MKLKVHGTAGPWVVKVSGIAGGVRLYDEEVTAAVGAGFRVIALDTSGDRHDDPAREPITWELLAAEVEAAIAQVGADRAVVWGTSFGCLVALAAAVRRPARIRGLLLCHPPDALRQPRAYPELLAWAARRRRPDLAARLLFSLSFGALTSWEAVAPALWWRLPALLSASIEAATPASTVRRKLELLFGDDPGVPSASSMGVEIVAGAWDLVAPLSGARRVADRLPGARMTIMGYSGHAGAYARPRSYHRIVTGALARLS
jgi:aminoacrylate hydrolase